MNSLILFLVAQTFIVDPVGKFLEHFLDDLFYFFYDSPSGLTHNEHFWGWNLFTRFFFCESTVGGAKMLHTSIVMNCFEVLITFSRGNFIIRHFYDAEKLLWPKKYEQLLYLNLYWFRASPYDDIADLHLNRAANSSKKRFINHQRRDEDHFV